MNAFVVVSLDSSGMFAQVGWVSFGRGPMGKATRGQLETFHHGRRLFQGPALVHPMNHVLTQLSKLLSST